MVLFGQTRRAVLGLLLGHPDESYYLRQVARLTGAAPAAVQRELVQLVAAGIVERTDQGRQAYFRANARCPVFPELRGLVTKTAGAAGVIAGALTPLAERVRVAFIYGSVAGGDEKRDSDVDVMVVGDVSFAEVARALRPAQDRLHREVNPSVYPPSEFAEKVRGGHHFLSSVLKGDMIFVVGGTNELERLAEERVAEGTRDEPARDRGPARGGRPRPRRLRGPRAQ